ncbi:MAG: methylmalonyl-CoA mutase [Eudoraea sp.]|nr:methylmalonyl-CoA mutase [Eudoraea sp.]
MKKTNWLLDFPAVSAKGWKQQIQTDLKGADYNEHLLWPSPEQIDVKPFYHAEDMEEIQSSKIAHPKNWQIGQEIYAQNASMSNQKALDAIARGAESIVFKVPSEDIDPQILLKNIDLATIPVHLKLDFVSPAFCKKLHTLEQGGTNNLSIQIDILGHLASTGNWYNSLEQDHTLLRQIYEEIGSIPFLGIDGSLFKNAGANRVQELAYTLSQAHEYVAFFEDQKNGLVCAPVFTIAVDSNYFFEIAKIRALRILWATLAREYKAPENCHIIAHPAKRNKTLYEYNTNLLRTTTECMAAVLGGANTICNQPYDAIYHKDNEFGERIARNQLLILKNESYFGAVSNAADGAYYIESLTNQLAAKALALFKNIEAAGGFLKSIKNHTLQKKIRESADKELLRFESKEEVLVGSNKYENTQDTMKDSLEIYPFLKTQPVKTLLEPILEKRLAEALEQKRLDNE